MELLGLVDLPLWSVLLAIASVLTYIYLTWSFSFWSKRGIPGPKPWPLIGTFYSAIKAGGFHQHDPAAVKKYGKIIGGYRGRTPVLEVADPEFLRQALVKNFNSMPNRLDVHQDSIFDSFMTILSDDHWRHVRSSLTPTFTTGKLKLLKTRIDECAERFLRHVKDTDGQPFKVKKFCGGYTMDTISSTAFGVQIDSLNDPNHLMTFSANKVIGADTTGSFFNRIKNRVLIAILFLSPSPVQTFLRQLGLSILDPEALAYFEGVTGQIIADRGLDQSKHKDFIQLCLDKLIDDPKLSDPGSQLDKYGKVWSPKGLTKDEIIANAILFFIAGYEGTSLTLHYILYELALNPDIQDQAYEEVKKNMDSDVATYEELMKMEYVDWIINEALRLYPPAPRLERLVAKDTVVEGVHLTEGCMVSAMVYAIHHDAELWPEPERFNPERFSAENKEGRHQYAWIPFGIGNRNCIGMRLALLNIKVALVKLLRSFEFEPCAETPSKPVELTKNFRVYPMKEIKLVAKCRKTLPAE